MTITMMMIMMTSDDDCGADLEVITGKLQSVANLQQ